MSISKYTTEIIKSTKETLEDFLFKCRYRANPKDFSRERKMGFKDTVLFMLNMVKKSLQLELDSFLIKC